MKIVVFSGIIFEIYLGSHSGDHKRISTANLLNIKFLGNNGLATALYVKRFAVQTFLWSPECNLK